MELQGWVIFITNIPANVLSAQQVSLVYRLRWQIEIIFKLWKSDAGLAEIGAWRLERVLCQLYARLIALVVFHWLSSPWRFGINYELSLPVAYRLLQKYAYALVDVVLSGWVTFSNFLQRLEFGVLRFACKTSRKKTTFHLCFFACSQCLNFMRMGLAPPIRIADRGAVRINCRLRIN